MSIGYAKLCSSVQDHNQSLIHKGSGWTSQRAKEFILKLKASEENASEENAPEDDEFCFKKYPLQWIFSKCILNLVLGFYNVY